MSLNKIIGIFVIIFVFFVGIIFFQFNKTGFNRNASPTPTPIMATVSINNVNFTVEVVKTPDLQQKGLSGRNSLGDNKGMLFLFNKTDYVSFWMKDMHFPLDIIFIRDNTIITIKENVPPPANSNANLPIYNPDEPINKVLEVNAGTAKKNGFKKGDVIKINL